MPIPQGFVGDARTMALSWTSSPPACGEAFLVSRSTPVAITGRSAMTFD